MQRCYKEACKTPHQHDEACEVRRWRWFRKYLVALTETPLSVIWNGLPNQSDFFADMPPVTDPTAALLSQDTQNGQASFPLQSYQDLHSYQDLQSYQEKADDFKEMEFEARRELYLFVKLGNWLASLPVTVARLADLLVCMVRYKETFPDTLPAEWRLKYYWAFIRLFFTFLRHVCFSPQWFPERRFPRTEKEKTDQENTEKRPWTQRGWIRPLFGWKIYILGWAIMLPSLFIVVVLALAAWREWMHFPSFWRLLPGWLRSELPVLDWLESIGSLLRLLRAYVTSLPSWIYLVVGVGVAGIAALAVHWFRQWRRSSPAARRARKRRLVAHVLRQVELERHLVHDFHLRAKLTRLFGKDGRSPLIDDDPMPIVLVAAPLQTLTKKGTDAPQKGTPARRPQIQTKELVAQQLWAKPKAPLVEAIRTAMGQPGLFRPLSLENEPGKQQWVSADTTNPRLDLVDGIVVRQNPIPALFSFLRKDENRAIAKGLSSEPGDHRVHVVYNVPIGPRRPSQDAGTLPIDIVDIGRASLRLNRRRDTELEVKQTNFISKMENTLKTCAAKPSENVFPIFADEIAPETHIAFKNLLSPARDEILAQAAHGCRRTLETLYKAELQKFPSGGEKISCPAFLVTIATHRKWNAQTSDTPGLPEVCARCTKMLARPETPVEPLLSPVKGVPGESPRIVFLASGGVFRGPFHAGMLACLLVSGIRPQLIVGASVGTLMGGALGTLLSAKDAHGYPKAVQLLGELAEVFLHVDTKVAFTKTLKSAAREIGLRGRAIKLSPNMVRRMIRHGSRSDPGFAAVGAPAALIDAISDFFMIPHRATSKIAADFVAGHVTKATRSLLEQLKKETLRRLDIECALIGVSLLEPTARQLLGESIGIPMDRSQPFPGIAFFGTTTDLVTESSCLLGRYPVGSGHSYDFVQAALASSAFPCVFSPRRESEILPGEGRSDVFFSDGGMFDNLPFLPAIEILAAAQQQHRAEKKDDLPPFTYLAQRHAAPDLFLAGSLDVNPESDPERLGPFNDLISIVQRSALLKNNVKIRAFEQTSSIIHEQIDSLLAGKNLPQQTDGELIRFIDSIVDAAVLPVFPTDREHLNPTYAFCASTGFKKQVVQKSIADGCFQTFQAFGEAQRDPHANLAAHAVDELTKRQRIPKIDWTESMKGLPDGACPYFRSSARPDPSPGDGKGGYPGTTSTEGGPAESEGRMSPPDLQTFRCPFFAADTSSAKEIYRQCVSDPSHRRPPARRQEKLA